MPLSGIIFLIAFALIVVAAPFVTHGADRKRVARLMVQHGGTILRIERSVPVARSLVSERNTTFWRVRYRAADGTTRVAEVFVSFLRCKIYRDEQVASK